MNPSKGKNAVMMSEQPQLKLASAPNATSGMTSLPDPRAEDNISMEKRLISLPKSSAAMKIALAAGAIALVLAVGIGGIFGGGGSSDQPTRAQIAEMQNSWNAARSSGVSLPLVKQAEMAEAIESTRLPEPDKAALREEVDSGRVSLVWITVWDNMAEDGDIVSLSSDGLTVTVPLYIRPQRIALPRPAGGVVNLTGTHDGGGGITLGLLSGSDTVLIPPLDVGEAVGIPVH